MLLDQFGKQILPPFVSQMSGLWNDFMRENILKAFSRTFSLKPTVLYDPDGHEIYFPAQKIGDTITVKYPRKVN